MKLPARRLTAYRSSVMRESGTLLFYHRLSVLCGCGLQDKINHIVRKNKIFLACFDRRILFAGRHLSNRRQLHTGQQSEHHIHKHGEKSSHLVAGSRKSLSRITENRKAYAQTQTERCYPLHFSYTGIISGIH